MRLTSPLADARHEDGSRYRCVDIASRQRSRRSKKSAVVNCAAIECVQQKKTVVMVHDWIKEVRKSKRAIYHQNRTVIMQ